MSDIEIFVNICSRKKYVNIFLWKETPLIGTSKDGQRERVVANEVSNWDCYATLEVNFISCVVAAQTEETLPGYYTNGIIVVFGVNKPFS